MIYNCMVVEWSKKAEGVCMGSEVSGFQQTRAEKRAYRRS
jgi:hypothetical protein